MKSLWIDQNPKTLAAIFDAGDELVAGLRQLAAEYHLVASRFTGIGACSELGVGFFNLEKKTYEKIIYREQMEVLSLAGDIAMGEIHAHIVAGRADGTAHGGHLMHAIVCPTLEIIVTESPIPMQRKFNPKFGLALIDLDGYRQANL